LLLLGVGSGAGYYLRRDSLPEPPVLDLAQEDRAVVAAVESARGKVRRAPRDAQAWGMLGMVLYANDYVAESADCFLQAGCLDAREPRWPYYRAVALATTEPDAALAELRRAVDLWGDTEVMPRLRLADLLLEQGRMEEAQEQFRHVLRQAPNNSLAHLGLARLAAQSNDADVSLKHLENCLEDCATEKPARTLRAELYHRKGDGVAAERERGRAAQLPEPGSAIDPVIEEMVALAVGRRAVIAQSNRLLALGRAREASVLLLEAVREYPDSERVWQSLGKAYLEQKAPAEAERAFRKALLCRPDLVDASFSLGVALLEQGQTVEAGQCFRRTVELRPEYVRAHCYLGHCLEEQGKRADAIGAYRTALRYKPYFAHAHMKLAELLARDGRIKEAREHLELAVSLDPKDREARELLEKYGR
jgi:tetratricopeptide (TPR) repeat protein